jgi:hypothetical protein
MKSSDKISKKNISPAEARRRAARFVIGNLFKGVRVQDGATAKWNIDGVRRKDVWVVYRHQKRDDGWIPAQDLMVVCKRTGRVLYDRLAFPEADVRPARSQKSKPIPKTGKRWLDSRWWE